MMAPQNEASNYNMLMNLGADGNTLTPEVVRGMMVMQCRCNIDFFRERDQNGSGCISREDLSPGFAADTEESVQEKFLDILFEEFDAARSGTIKYEQIKMPATPKQIASDGANEPRPASRTSMTPDIYPDPVPTPKREPKSLRSITSTAKLSVGSSISKPKAHPLPFSKIRIVLPGAKPTYDALEHQAVYDDTKAFDAYELVNDVCQTNRGSAQLAIITHPLQDTGDDLPGVVVRRRPFHHRLASAGWSIIAYEAHALGADGDGQAEAEKLRAVMAYVAKHMKFRYCRCALLTQGTSASAAFMATHLDPDRFDALKVISACQPSGDAALREALIEEYAPKCSLPVIVTAAASSTVTPETVIARRLHYAVSGPKKAIQIPPSYPLYGQQRRFEGVQYFADHPKKLIKFIEDHSQPTNIKQRRLKPVSKFAQLRSLRKSQSGLLESHRLGLLHRPQSASSEIRLDHELGDDSAGLAHSASMPILDPIKRDEDGGDGEQAE